jgi:hypothetical protein
MFKNQSVIVEMPPSKTAETKNLSTKMKICFRENVLSLAQQTVDSADLQVLKIERLQLFFGEESRAGLQHRRLDSFSSPSPFDLGLQGAPVPPRRWCHRKSPF